MRQVLFALSILCLLLSSCADGNGYTNAINSINEEDLAAYVSKLASDEFMGRGPFTEGETLTIAYLAEKLAAIGFEPAFGDSYFQEIPMIKLKSKITEAVTIESNKRKFTLSSPDNIAISSPRVNANIKISKSEMVFAGFGITAPEYDWNDFENINVTGKTLVVLVNDPGLYTKNQDLFKGTEMTYYGRWNYKFEEAARRGAQGVLIVHETEGAGYSYSIPKSDAITPNLYMDKKNGNNDQCMFNGWIEAETAKDLFAELGYDIEQLRADACKPGFSGFDMDTRISLEISNSIEYNHTTNVAGVLKGTSDPDEVIIYSGHWDHLGISEVQNGDSIFNGAVDNGTTMAMIFEIGEAFSKLKTKPLRSVMLFFPTAEEQGRLGSKYYTENPAFKINNTVANINNDLVLPIGRMKDVMITGYGQSDLDDMIAELASKQDRYIYPDPNPQTGMYFRADHFSFASVGIPALYARGNCESREFGREWAALQEKDYIANRYHKAADNYDPATWDFSGIVEDGQLLFELGHKLANSDIWPEWKEGSEFKGKRERQNIQQ